VSRCFFPTLTSGRRNGGSPRLTLRPLRVTGGLPLAKPWLISPGVQPRNPDMAELAALPLHARDAANDTLANARPGCTCVGNSFHAPLIWTVRPDHSPTHYLRRPVALSQKAASADLLPPRTRPGVRSASSSNAMICLPCRCQGQDLITAFIRTASRCDLLDPRRRGPWAGGVLW